MRVSAKVDYALRAAAELAAASDGPVEGEQIASAQGIPLKFLENIVLELRHHGLVQSQRGADTAAGRRRQPRTALKAPTRRRRPSGGRALPALRLQ
jgi:hypothetical protein